MKKLYLIIGMDKLNGNIFYPGPCLFETKQEANEYIKQNDDKNTKYCRRVVYLGKMKIS